MIPEGAEPRHGRVGNEKIGLFRKPVSAFFPNAPVLCCWDLWCIHMIADFEAPVQASSLASIDEEQLRLTNKATTPFEWLEDVVEWCFPVLVVDKLCITVSKDTEYESIAISVIVR